MEDINVNDLHDRLKAGEKLHVIDVREEWEYEEFNIGAKLIPLGDLMNKVWELEDIKGEEIILHCKSGQRSGMAKALLEAQGFTKVRNLLGGMVAWKETYGNEKP